MNVAERIPVRKLGCEKEKIKGRKVAGQGGIKVCS